MKSTKEIYDMLPTTWAEVKLKHFKAIDANQVLLQDEDDNLFTGRMNVALFIAAVSGESLEDIEAIPGVDFASMANKVNGIFFSEPKENKSKVKFKTLQEFSYADFESIIRTSLDVEKWAFNLKNGIVDVRTAMKPTFYQEIGKVVAFMSYKEKVFNGSTVTYIPYTPEEIEEFSLEDINTGFFLLTSSVTNALNSSAIKIQRKMISESKMKTSQKAKLIMRLFGRKAKPIEFESFTKLING